MLIARSVHTSNDSSTVVERGFAIEGAPDCGAIFGAGLDWMNSAGLGGTIGFGDAVGVCDGVEAVEDGSAFVFPSFASRLLRI